MKRQILSKYTLAISDFISFSLSFILSLVLLNYSIERFDAYLPLDQVRERMIIHLSLGFIGVIWFWIRLRHYTYRKPFWFELKEVIRTLIILAIIELATIAFSKLYFSRYLWGLTWGVTFFFVPIVRILTKKILIDTGLYIKNTVIIGGGNNNCILN